MLLDVKPPEPQKNTKTAFKKQCCIPSSYNGEFVARMEDILETYALPYDPDIPLVWMNSLASWWRISWSPWQ
jgi:hypothetical protein